MANQVGEINVKIGADTAGLNSGVDKANNKLDTLGNKSNKAGKSLSNVSMYAKAGALALGALAIKGALVADNFSRLETRVRTATGSTAEFNAAMDGLYKSAQSSGVALEGTVSAFQNISASAKEIGKTTEDSVEFVDIFQKLGVIGGASTAEINNSLRQMSQSIAGGIMRAEEFNSVVENTPAVARAIAEGMGLTVGELRNAVLEGKVLAEDVFNALQSQADATNSKFAQMPLTIEQAGTALSNSIGTALADLTKFDEEVAGVNSLTEAVAVGIKGWSVFLDDGVDGLVAYRDTLVSIEDAQKRIRLTRGNIGLDLEAESNRQIYEEMDKQLSVAENMQSWMEMRSDATQSHLQRQKELAELAEREKLAQAEKIELLAQEYQWQEDLAQFTGENTGIEQAEKAQAEMTEMERRHAQFRIDNAKNEAIERKKAMSSMMGDLSSLMNSGSKEMFEIGKVAATTNAVMAGYEAAVHSFNAGAKIGGPVVGAAFAAASVASTAVQIQQIQSQQFGSGATGGATSYSAGVPAVNTQAAQPTGGTLTVEGLSASSLFTGDAVAAIATELLDYQREGGQVVLQS